SINPQDYARGRTFQEIREFRTAVARGEGVDTTYGEVVSYGIRRFAFDAYLLGRSGARVITGTPAERITRTREGWAVNDSIRSRVLVGAAGHFCPVARLVADAREEALVLAQETEICM